jgi:hypothetical protein
MAANPASQYRRVCRDIENVFIMPAWNLVVGMPGSLSPAPDFDFGKPHDIFRLLQCCNATLICIIRRVIN